MVDRTLLICGSILIIAVILFAGSGIFFMSNNNANAPPFKDNFQKQGKIMNGPSNNPGPINRHNQGPDRQFMPSNEENYRPGPDSFQNGALKPCQRDDKSEGQGPDRQFMLSNEENYRPGPDSVQNGALKPCQRDDKSEDYKNINNDGKKLCKGEQNKEDGISKDKGFNHRNVCLIYICYTQPDSDGNMLVHIEKKELP